MFLFFLAMRCWNAAIAFAPSGEASSGEIGLRPALAGGLRLPLDSGGGTGMLERGGRGGGRETSERAVLALSRRSR